MLRRVPAWFAVSAAAFACAVSEERDPGLAATGGQTQSIAGAASEGGAGNIGGGFTGAGSAGSEAGLPGGGASAGAVSMGGSTAQPADPLALKQDCGAVPRDQATPTSIDAAVQLINTLPKPLSLACFLSALQKPLKLNLTRSVISAQPSVGLRSPRVFMFFDKLIMSVVPEGDGSALLEFGQLVDGETRSVKAEILFPVTETLARAAPFQRILYSKGTPTVCGVCHSAEARYDGIDYAPAYVSKAVKPDATYAMPLSLLNQELTTCDDALEFERCEMLRALLRGTPAQQSFPDAMTPGFQ